MRCFPWRSDIAWPELRGAVWHEEYDRPLGPPRGAATLLPDGKTLRREFASGTVVTLDTSTQLFSGRFEWGEVHDDRQ